MTATSEKAEGLPSTVTDAVLVPSNEMPEGSQKVEELDFNNFAGRAITVDDLMNGMNHMGFQASSIGKAVRIINDMVCLFPLLPNLHPAWHTTFSFPKSLLLHHHQSLLCILSPSAIRYLLMPCCTPNAKLTPSPAFLARHRNLISNHDIPWLHLKPDLLWPAWHPPLPRPTLARLSNRHHRWWHRRRPH